MEDRLEAKSNAHAGELIERAKPRLEHVATDSKHAAKAAAILGKRELIKKRATAPLEGPDELILFLHKNALFSQLIFYPLFFNEDGRILKNGLSKQHC